MMNEVRKQAWQISGETAVQTEGTASAKILG